MSVVIQGKFHLEVSDLLLRNVPVHVLFEGCFEEVPIIVINVIREKSNTEVPHVTLHTFNNPFLVLIDIAISFFLCLLADRSTSYETTQWSLFPGVISRFEILSGFVVEIRTSMLSFRVGLSIKLALTKSNMALLS